MDVWQIALYVFASFWALRSLVSLMSQHRQIYAQEYFVKESMRLQRKAAKAKPLEASPEEAKQEAEDAA